MKQTALIVNPRAQQLEPLREFLSGAHYDVLAASHEDEAVELCRSYAGAIDLLVTDVELPGTRGWKLAEMASRLRPGLMVLFLPPSNCENSFSPVLLLQVAQALSRKAQQNKRLN